MKNDFWGGFAGGSTTFYPQATPNPNSFKPNKKDLICYYNTGEGDYPNGPIELMSSPRPGFIGCISYFYNNQQLYKAVDQSFLEKPDLELLVACFTDRCNQPPN